MVSFRVFMLLVVTTLHLNNIEARPPRFRIWRRVPPVHVPPRIKIPDLTLSGVALSAGAIDILSKVTTHADDVHNPILSVLTDAEGKFHAYKSSNGKASEVNISSIGDRQEFVVTDNPDLCKRVDEFNLQNITDNIVFTKDGHYFEYNINNKYLYIDDKLTVRIHNTDNITNALKLSDYKLQANFFKIITNAADKSQDRILHSKLSDLSTNNNVQYNIIDNSNAEEIFNDDDKYPLFISHHENYEFWQKDMYGNPVPNTILRKQDIDNFVKTNPYMIFLGCNTDFYGSGGLDNFILDTKIIDNLNNAFSKEDMLSFLCEIGSKDVHFVIDDFLTDNLLNRINIQIYKEVNTANGTSSVVVIGTMVVYINDSPESKPGSLWMPVIASGSALTGLTLFFRNRARKRYLVKRQ
ncbi:hypothetical protein [Spirosoma sp. KNUC1025]|uniref:hypothetical protein n=1 Tax=Spirosoma sp. KNUC1025 TaxID=2894082 RepID=UPI003864C048|nr:hypothetical protein LN737_04490 [Spirosoma sp. KNUC1025]